VNNIKPFKIFKLKDKTIIQLFQGNRGTKPHLDFKVKHLEPGRKLRTPSHTHWLVDLIMKAEIDKESVHDFSEFLIGIYDKATPFKSLKERKNYNLKHIKAARRKFGSMKGGKYSPEYITAIVELFSICEKQYAEAYMFKKSLNLIQKYAKGESDYYTLVSHSKQM